MNYGRGFPLPQYGNGNRSRNREPWIPEMGIPAENGIGQISMFGQQFQQRGEMERLGETLRRPIMVDDGMIRGKELESESWKTSIVRTSQMRNGIVGSNNNRDSYTTIHQGNGIVRNGNGNGNGENWNPVIPTNLYSQGNCSNSWTPVTPGKSNPCNKPVNQVESENWGNLLGMYGDLLRPDTLNLNEVAQDRYPMVQNNGNQNRVLSTTNRNLNPILNSSHIPIPKPTHDLNQVLPSVSYFPSEDRANWDSGLLAAIVRPKKSSTSVPFFNESQNNSFHDLNQKPVSDSSTQVESNSVRPTHVGSMLGNQNSNQLPSDGFSVPYRPCYNLNSPPRSELDAASSGITGQLPFTPITPDTRQKSTENQWVPVKNGQESQRNEDADNVYNDLFTSSAVSTTQKEGLVSEEGEELGIDLNKTPNQKTPARRKKHRPKVIREGKVKKSATPKDVKNTGLNETPVKRKYVRKSPKENGVEISPEGIKGRRKYVRKKGVESVDQSVSQQKTQVEEATEPILETPVKSCKKQLNFDLECGARDESRTRVDQSGFNLNDNPQDIEQERRINLERSSMRVAQNNMYAGVTTHQESPRINGPATPMANARDHALNVLARNLLMRNAVSGQGVWRNVSNHVGPVSTNGHSQTVNYDERRGIKRPSFEQINPRNLNAMDSLYMYQKLLLRGDNHTDLSNDLSSFIESQKRAKMQNDLSTRRPEGNPRGELTQNNGVYGNEFALRILNSCTGKFNPSSQVNGRQSHPALERSQRPSQGHEVNSLTAMVRWNRPPPTPPKDYSRPAVGSYPDTFIDKKRTTMQNSASQRSNRAMLQIRKDNPQVHQMSFPKPRGGPRKPKGVVSVEALTSLLEELCIYEKNKNKDRNVLVLYRGDNAIIPFEPIKKRKPRPKVDLDPESDRLWKLLMGPEGSTANETLDKDKEKWWEDERRVFRGRADSFIARMHLVQGDRRFSRWKGSVVDSVIGVYLTQNVSDHLSSSAFMSLAAKFPIKVTNTNETHCQDGACVLVEEPIETILPINKILRQPVFNQSSYVAFESSDHIKLAANSEVILSQDSLDSSTIQTVDEIRSSSGSNSEAEDQTNGFESSRYPAPPNHVQPEKVNLFRELFSHDRSQYMWNLPKTPSGNMQNMGSASFGSFPTNKSGITEGYTSNLTFQQNEIPRFQVENSPHKQDSCSENCVFENATAESNSKEQNGPNNNILKGRNTEDEKKKTFDWDSLRRDVFSKCEKKERSKDAADSLDYEALRRARVNEISDTIRERGMNNLLADRIKDFLDRLVRDHGSIDLEWLRDVPPDKAKDYLLSIRGLGLKSVECVRLLTLHHLAFPVDTNVGRIAVRLGWVPLQPLPESLQLHLLEMYPVLESIQKYLWPRLCKLDQLTLYELHYQMITFGKVFCTKSKPNCNACPMRAECRHFASAFASARLALPGPEEKRMVPSDTPNVIHTMPPEISRPMSLPPAEINCNKDVRFLCEPIIEEPSTPEPETAELTLSDIEDHYYDDDDDDEIPTIKLDMNEFTMNLQNSMEINGDMSKALVALNPQAASIPTPKLKNVSRLRTEHLVYELPDSHPILEGLYKREPDDPSHYLLAIWTPGETANSMQPPERGCPAQESGMLCDSTTCFSCNCIKEANSQVVRGTILMPCRTAMRGSFPLNGTYFQVNEMFADHASSLKPIDVPRSWIWNLPRRTVYFGTSVSTIFKGLTTPEIQMCFWRGFVCVRGFDQKTRSPRPLMARLHFPASKLVKNKNEDK